MSTIRLPSPDPLKCAPRRNSPPVRAGLRLERPAGDPAIASHAARLRPRWDAAHRPRTHPVARIASCCLPQFVSANRRERRGRPQRTRRRSKICSAYSAVRLFSPLRTFRSTRARWQFRYVGVISLRRASRLVNSTFFFRRYQTMAPKNARVQIQTISMRSELNHSHLNNGSGSWMECL